MLSKTKSSGRLSALFTSFDPDHANSKSQPTSAAGRLSPNTAAASPSNPPLERGTHSREPSAGTLLPPPAYPHAPSASISRKPILQTNTDSLAPSKPAHLRSRSASPAVSRRRPTAESVGSDSRSRPTTPGSQYLAPSPQPSPDGGKGKVKRKHWLHKSKDGDKHTARPSAWILGDTHQKAYDVAGLVNAQRVGNRK